MSVRSQIRLLEKMIEELGLEAEIIKSKNHLQIMIEGPLGKRKVTASGTPSDHRANMNLKSDLRKTAIEIGALVEE